MDFLSINAGELRDRIEFYTTSSTKDDGGGYAASTKTLAFGMFARVEPKPSKKSYEGGKVEYTDTWEIKMRYEAGRVPSESYKVKYKNEFFSIIGIENVMNRNLVLKLTIVKK